MMKPKLVICDIETTGLNPTTESILEVAAIAVDADLREIATFEALVDPDPLHISGMTPFVREMHEKNGLLSDLNPATVMPILALDNLLSSWLRRLGYEGKDVMLAGNSIDFDHSFLTHHLPQVRGMLSYRKLDISATSRFLTDIGLYVRGDAEMPHRAMADARLELAELRHITMMLRTDRERATAFTRVAENLQLMGYSTPDDALNALTVGQMRAQAGGR